MKYNVALIPGDGIGPELTETTLQVLNAVQDKFSIELELNKLEAGDRCMEELGVPLPDETIEAIRNSDVCIKGPVGETAADVIVKLRMIFDLYANIRPIKSYPGVPCLRKDIDLIFVRENIEGLYKGFEFIFNETAIGLRIVSRKGSERIAKKAFEIALNRKKKVTAVHKSNVMRLTCGLFATVCRETAKKFPETILNEQYVDAASMRLIKEPQNYDVIVTTNMFGDILSDEAAQLVGGLGMAPGGNIGDNFALFEPVHGSAPTRVGKHTANPCSMILASKMMLEWLGERFEDLKCSKAAVAVEVGVTRALRKGLSIPDFGGNLTTIEMGEAIATEILHL